MILYFSATGNCKYAAEALAEATGDRTVALRLTAGAPPPAAAPAWRHDAAYLITGGFGGVAQALARELVANGVRRLVLLGRTPLPPRAEWVSCDPDSPVGRRIAAVRELERLGAAVHVLVADVADASQLAAALDGYAGESWPPIAGVVHAAGVLDHQLVDHADAAATAATMAPKLEGAQLLDRLLPDADLFVMMSSIAAFWGTPGLAAYAAANAGIDALAAQRRQRGRHALSIQWGPWHALGMHGVGMDPRARAEMAADGVSELDPADACTLLNALAADAEATVAVLDVDPARLGGGSRGAWPLFGELAELTGRGGQGAPDGSQLAEALAAADPSERATLLEALVRSAVGGVLRSAPAELDVHRPFGSLGLDSLMALELRTHLAGALGREFPASLAWNYPTIAALTEHLAALTAPDAGVTDPPADARTRPAAPVEVRATDDSTSLGAVLSELAALTDDDAASALRNLGR